MVGNAVLRDSQLAPSQMLTKSQLALQLQLPDFVHQFLVNSVQGSNLEGICFVC